MNDLQRFLDAQEKAYAIALAEIRHGRKESHWMWYIFPQIAGLGSSETSRRFAIKNLDEASDYLQHAVLGARLIEICKALLLLESNDAGKIFGTPDDLKLRSSMTLFSSVPDADGVFQRVLDKFFNGKRDPKTMGIIDRQ